MCCMLDIVPEINLPVNKTILNENEYSYIGESDWKTYTSDTNHPVRIFCQKEIIQQTNSDPI